MRIDSTSTNTCVALFWAHTWPRKSTSKGQTAKGAAGREKEAAPKTHKLSDVVKALWPRWVDQFGLVTGPSSMGIVNAKQDDLSLEPWRGDSDMEDDEWRCWVWDDDAAKTG